MKIVYPVCCGVDVHKLTIVATIATTDKNNITSYSLKSFSTLNKDLYAFRDWLLENNCRYVCVESTGKYWIPIFNILEDHVHVILTHPKYVRAIKGPEDRQEGFQMDCGLIQARYGGSFLYSSARGSFLA